MGADGWGVRVKEGNEGTRELGNQGTREQGNEETDILARVGFERFMGESAMSRLNPYDSFLDGRRLETIVALTSTGNAAVLATIGLESRPLRRVVASKMTDAN